MECEYQGNISDTMVVRSVIFCSRSLEFPPVFGSGGWIDYLRASPKKSLSEDR